GARRFDRGGLRVRGGDQQHEAEDGGGERSPGEERAAEHRVRRDCKLGVVAATAAARCARAAAREEQEGEDRDADRRMMGRVQPGEDAADLGDVDPEAADELSLGRVIRVEEAVVVALEHVVVAGLADDAMEYGAAELKGVVADYVAD